MKEAGYYLTEQEEIHAPLSLLTLSCFKKTFFYIDTHAYLYTHSPKTNAWSSCSVCVHLCAHIHKYMYKKYTQMNYCRQFGLVSSPEVKKPLDSSL